MSQPKLRGRPPKSRNQQSFADTSDARWTIRGVPKNVRRIAVQCAENRNLTTGDWVSEAIVSYSKADTNGIMADGSKASAVVKGSDMPPDIEKLLESRLTAFKSQVTTMIQETMWQTGQTKKKDGGKGRKKSKKGKKRGKK